MVKFSVIYLTYRHGGYELLADGLAGQTCQDYELICVDELTQFHEIRESYLRGRGVRLSAILPSKKPCFKNMAYNLINAYNTGVMMSKGDYIIICNDFTWLPPDALAKWETREDDLNRKTAISGVGAILHINPPTDLYHPISLWAPGSADAAMRQMHKHFDPHLSEMWIPRKFELFYSIFSYDLITAMNGFRECHDYTINPIPSAIKEVGIAGGTLDVDHNNRIYMIEHRRFEFNYNPGEWHLSKRVGSGSRSTLIEEPNCFDLRTHARGTIPPGEEGSS